MTLVTPWRKVKLKRGQISRLPFLQHSLRLQYLALREEETKAQRNKITGCKMHPNLVLWIFLHFLLMQSKLKGYLFLIILSHTSPTRLACLKLRKYKPYTHFRGKNFNCQRQSTLPWWKTALQQIKFWGWKTRSVHKHQRTNSTLVYQW